MMKKTTLFLSLFLLSLVTVGQIDTIGFKDEVHIGLDELLQMKNDSLSFWLEKEHAYPYDSTKEIIIYDSLMLQTDSMKALLFPSKIPYDWISYRMKVEVSLDGDNRSVQLFFVNRIDSIIYLNISILGIELIRIVATPDTVTYVNKMSYEYYQGGYLLFKAFTGIDLTFNMLQALFNAVDFADYDWNFTVDDVETEVHLFAESRCDTSSTRKPLCLKQHVILNNSLLPSCNRIDIPDQGQSLYMSYDQYDYSLDFPFFSIMMIEIPSENIRIRGELKTPKFNIPGPTGIKIPPKFEPVKVKIEQK
ncbi:DUF4292 domain-containing protein [Bacteroidales bacterium OttesenSCG-928-E04]|nr:DUF4292 domain-containing protein [Bacteroidales bacterium OttesenSCG-928-E04]MDL2326627.1 DUF4292 domain-containing protein [Bacteroidales bacterium OttesenSCG-928-A14]